jgi:hypothetical protein
MRALYKKVLPDFNAEYTLYLFATINKRINMKVSGASEVTRITSNVAEKNQITAFVYFVYVCVCDWTSIDRAVYYTPLDNLCCSDPVIRYKKGIIIPKNLWNSLKLCTVSTSSVKMNRRTKNARN